MIELPDLFHENRIPELSLSLILYAPIGLCLLLIRSIFLGCLFLLAYFLPKNPSYNQVLNEILSLIFTITSTDETAGREENRKRTKILVANRVSILDTFVLSRFLANNNCQAVILSNENVGVHWLRLNFIHSNQDDLFDLCSNQIQQSNAQLIFLPECEPTTGCDGLLKFNLLPFTLAQKSQLPVQPVCLRTSRAFQIRTSTFNSQPWVDLLWFLFSPYTQYHLNFLPIVSPTDTSTPENLSAQVRENIARALNLELTDFDRGDVAELKKRPDLFQRRRAQRRAELQQMINLVHQQVPLASLEAIRYDLETTKNVQKTIANLTERAAAAARAAAANKSPSSSASISSAMNKSSGSGGHRQTYERLKQELIEKNRQLFLNKNCN